MRLEHVRESLTGTHCRYRQYMNGIPTDAYETRACDSASAGALLALANATQLDARAGLRYVEGVLIRRAIVEEGALEPYAYDYDVATNRLVRRTPLFFRSAAQVFDPNPVVTLNDPTLQDQNDAAAAVPPSAYSHVTLRDVAPFGPLRGPHATLVDRQRPDIEPPDGSGSLVFNREDDGFEDVNAYFHIDRAQRYLQSLGYTGAKALVPYSIEIDAHAAAGADNSLFLPSPIRPGFGTLFFGEGGTDDAEDADLLVHEYTHAILEWAAPGTFGGSFPSQARALSEGYGDYWAWSAHVDERLRSGRDPYCFADWDARCWEDATSERCAYPPGSDCLRRLDSTKTMADYETVDSAGVEHRNGTIWSSALREIREQIGREAADRIVIESLFAMPPQPTFAAAARRLAIADRLLNGGAHATVICAAMIARGIAGGCGDAPKGELTLWPSASPVLAIPENDPIGAVASILVTDARAIEQLFVRVDIEHSARGDLRIELIAPDGTRVTLQEASFERTADVHATFGLDTASHQSLALLHGRSAAGVWRLAVRDLRSLDQGRLISWALLLQLEGDHAIAVRPRSEDSQMIPVVAHVQGVNGAAFRSDVRLANPGVAEVRATLLFTPSGTDGRTSFAAVDIALAAGQSVALDDIVASTFFTAGSGSLEVLIDGTGDALVASRTYAVTTGGTFGQRVPANLQTTAAGEPALVAASIEDVATRVNVGITETAGGAGIVRAGAREIAILPFSHIQMPLDPAAEAMITFEVIDGDARVAGYLSQVTAATNDAIFIPAERFTTAVWTLIAPAVSAPGVGGIRWESDVWMSAPAPGGGVLTAIAGGTRRSIALQHDGRFEARDVLSDLFDGPVTHAALLFTGVNQNVYSRIRGNGAAQLVPFLLPEGPQTQQLLFVDVSAGWRTNIGIVSASRAIAELVIFDSEGTELAREWLGTDGGIAQVPVLVPVRGGRATVRFLEGSGQAWASLVDNRTADATYVVGQ